MKRLLAIAAAFFCLAAAGDPADQLKNPVQEAHARQLFREIRCIVCQSESIDESDADLAHDVRQLVRQDVAAGESDAAIKADLVHRYGEFILLDPRFSLANAALWLTPFVIALLGIAAILASAGFRRRARESAAGADELTQAEAARVRSLIKE